MVTLANLAVLVDARELMGFCAEVLVQDGGLLPDEAALVAENLITADLRGVESHGVVRFQNYIDRLRAGGANPRPHIHTVRESRTTAVLDGDNGLGHLVGIRAMELAIQKAADGDCAFVSVRNSNHYGTAAFYTEMAARKDMIGISFTIGAINHMTPWGGAEAMLGNNPFSFAFPTDRDFPIVLDMACSIAARGKIIVAAKDGTPIPADWATGPDGKPTTDPVEALKGFVLPLGGPKGYALTLTVALLSTMLSGAAFGSEVGDLYKNIHDAQNVGHLFGVLPVASFEDIDVYRQRIGKVFTDLTSVKKVPGVDRIYLPGELEHLAMQRHRSEGVPINHVVYDELVALGKPYGLHLRALSKPRP